MGGTPSFFIPPAGVTVVQYRWGTEYAMDHPRFGKRRFMSNNLNTRYNSIRSYLAVEPVYVCTNADLIVPGFYIVDTLRRKRALEVVMSGEFKLDHITARCVATFDRDLELNQNFLRLLSIFPLALQAKGYEAPSLVISLAIILLDQCSIVANMAWKQTLKTIYSCYRFSILNRVPRPVWRYYLSVWLGSVSVNFLCCDESSYSFKFVKPGDVYPAMLNREVNADFFVYGQPVVYNYHTDDIVQYKIASDAKEVHYEGEIHAGNFEVYRVVSKGNEIRLYIDERGTFYCKNNFRDYCHGVGYDKSTLVNKLRLIEDCEMLPVCLLKDNAAHAISMEQWLTSKLSFVVFFKANASFHVGDSTSIIQ